MVRTGRVAAMVAFFNAAAAIPLALDRRAPSSTTPGLPIGLAPSAATTTSAAAVASSAPTPTWTIQVEVGQTAFDIGTADDTQFINLWHDACGANGCDGGTPQDFTFVTTHEIGAQMEYTGSFTMTGSVDNNQGWTDTLLDVINSAMLPAKQCNTTILPNCVGKRTITPPTECAPTTVTQCTLPNYIQATMYDQNSDQMAQITMSGSNPGGSSLFSCGTIVGAMGAGATAVDVAPPVAGAIAIVSVLCAF